MLLKCHICFIILFITLYLDKGKAHEKCAEFDTAKKIFLDSLDIGNDILEKNDRMRSEILNSLGDSYCNTGEIYESINCYKECLIIRQKQHDSLAISNTKHRIGSLFVRLNILDRAKAYYFDSIYTRTKELGCDNLEVAKSLYDIGKLFQIHSDESKKALKYIKEGKT